LVPIDMKPGASEVSYTVVEQTPVTRTLSIWNGDAVTAVSLVLQDTKDLDPKLRETLSKILEIIGKVGELDVKLTHLQRKKWEIDQRMEQTRENLKALKKNKSAGDLKNKLAKTLADLAKQGEDVTKEIVALTDERSTLSVSVDQMISELSFSN